MGKTVKQYLMVQTEGDREVQRKVDHYSLQAIIAVGFNTRCASPGGTSTRISITKSRCFGWLVLSPTVAAIFEQGVTSITRGVPIYR
jgi:hypothetical protein